MHLLSLYLLIAIPLEAFQPPPPPLWVSGLKLFLFNLCHHHCRKCESSQFHPHMPHCILHLTNSIFTVKSAFWSLRLPWLISGLIVLASSISLNYCVWLKIQTLSPSVLSWSINITPMLPVLHMPPFLHLQQGQRIYYSSAGLILCFLPFTFLLYLNIYDTFLHSGLPNPSAFPKNLHLSFRRQCSDH